VRVPSMNRASTELNDISLMRRCIEVSRLSIAQGEFPFGSLICNGDDILVEATNRVFRDGDVARHAELVALSETQKLLGRTSLTDCALYSVVEPCPMCSFCIRETGIRRVVYSIGSPLMGGWSKWNVLGDKQISEIMPEMFKHPPEVVSGLLSEEAEKVWFDWNPVAWKLIRERGCFTASALMAEPGQFPHDRISEQVPGSVRRARRPAPS
jgi:tRNA(adenine34) deaminase